MRPSRYSARARTPHNARTGKPTADAHKMCAITWAQVTISVERHMRNKKSQCMGVIDLDLTEFADADNPVVNKKLKLDIEEGPFELGTLRCYLSSKFVPGAPIHSAASVLSCAWACCAHCHCPAAP